MNSRLISFHAKDLLDLLTAYNDGRQIPLYCSVAEVQIHPAFPRMICLMVESKDWRATDADVNQTTGELRHLDFIYEGRRNMTFTPGQGTDPEWHDTPST